MTTSETIEAAKGMFPDYATIFACVCACLFTVVGVIGKLSGLFQLRIFVIKLRPFCRQSHHFAGPGALSKAAQSRHHCLHHLAVHLGSALLLHLDAIAGDPVRHEGVDTGRNTLPNIPGGPVRKRGRQSAQYGLHYVEQVKSRRWTG